MNLWMQQALAAAHAAGDRGEVPVGAVIVRDGTVIATSANAVIEGSDPTAHAEMEVLRAAAKVLKTPYLVDCDLYVTLEPCAMCAGAIALSRVRRLYFGAYDPKGGAVEHGPRFFTQPTCLHKPEIYGGILEAECSALLRTFFEGLRRP